MGKTASHDTLRQKLADGKLEPYLRHIRFPSYKNLAPGLRLEFTHPITAIVGPNGTNKTSILRAIEGCQADVSLGRYWFGTSLDLIDSKTTPRVIHGWNPPSVRQTVEAIKGRVKRPSDPDYWEPMTPKLRLGMQPLDPEVGVRNTRKNVFDGERSSDRWNPIPKDMVYLDFRAMLSAFDKYFFHQPTIRTPGKGSDGSRRRATVRRHAVHIRTSLDSRRPEHEYYGRNRVVSPGRSLDHGELAAVSKILDRQYENMVLLS